MKTLRLITFVVITTFLWSNLVWAGGLSSYKLAAQHQAVNVSPSLGELLFANRRLADLGVHTLADVVAQMEVLEKEGIMCLPLNDSAGRVARYLFSDNRIILRVTKAEEVNDDLYELLRRLGINGKREVVGEDVFEWFEIKNDAHIPLINSFLEKLNKKWVVNFPLPSGERACEARVRDTEGYSRIGLMVLITVFSVIAAYIMKYWGEILPLLLAAKFVLLILLIPVVFLISRVVFPVSYYRWLLKSVDLDIRERALDAIGKIRERSEIPALLKILKKEDFYIKAKAASSLLAILERNPGLERTYIERFGTDYKDILNAYILIEDCRWEALGISALPVLEAALVDRNKHIRLDAAGALGRIGDKRAIPLLKQALSDKDPEVRRNIIWALGRIGDESAIPELLDLLNDAQLAKSAATAFLEILAREPGLRDRYRERLVVLCVNILIEDYFGQEFLLKVGVVIIPELEALLGDMDVKKRRTAAELLGRIGDKSAAPALISALKEHDDYVRAAVIEALEKIGDDSAVPALKTALDEEDEDNVYTRIKIAEVLCRLGDKSGISVLLTLLGDKDGNGRTRAIKALGDIGDSSVIPALEAALRDEYYDVRTHAAVALGQIGDKRAVPALVGALNDSSNYVRRNSASALLAILDKNQDLEDAYKDRFGINYRNVLNAYITIADKELDSVASLGTDAIPAVEAMLKLDGDSYNRARAAESLGVIGDSSTIPLLVSALRDAERHIHIGAAKGFLAILDKNPGLRETYRQELVLSGSILIREYGFKKTVELGTIIIPVLDIMLEDTDYNVRADAAEVLSAILDKEPELASQKFGDNYKDVLSAYELIKWYRWDTTVVSLGANAIPALEAASRDRDIYIRRRALEALNRIRGESAEPVTPTASGDADSSMSLDAALILADKKDKRVIPVLLDALKSGDISARRGAARALGKLADSSAVQALIDVIQDKDYYLSVHAIEALGRIGDEKAVPALVALLEGQKRVIAAEALLNMKKYAATHRDELMSYILIRDEKWDDVIKLGKAAVPALKAALGDGDINAIKALARIRDSSAIAVLGDALRHEDRGIRAAAIDELGSMKDRLAVPALEIALGDDDYYLRIRAVRGLARIKDSSAVQALITALRHNCPGVRAESAWGLRDSSAIPALEVALEDIDPYVRINAAVSLGIMGVKSAIPVLMDALENKSYEVRGDAAEALVALLDTNPELKGPYQDKFGPGYRDVLKAYVLIGNENIYGVKELGTNALPALLATLRDEAGYFRLKAAEVLGEIGDKQAVPALTAALADGISDVQKAAAGALERIENSQARQSQYSRRIGNTKGKELMRLKLNHLGEIRDAEVLEARTDLERIKQILQTMLDEIKQKYDVGIFGAATEIILVDNLGGLDSAVAVFHAGKIIIDIDAFRNTQVLKDVLEHELWESILELVESNPAVSEVTSIYQNLKAFIEMEEEEQLALIAFLNQPENGLDSQGYAELLQYIVENKTKGDNLISLAISFVLKEPRYRHLRNSMGGILGEDIERAEEKLGLAMNIYEDLIKATTVWRPIIDKVKTAESKAKAIMKIRMIISRLPLIELPENKFIRLDIDELNKPENSHIVNWLQRILEGKQDSPFVFYSTTNQGVDTFLQNHNLRQARLPTGIKPEDIIELIEPAKVNNQLPQDRLYLPLPYAVSSIYLASQVVIAGGSIEQIKDNLVFTTIKALYESFLGGDITNTELEELFRTPWTILPDITQLTETLDTLRKAIAKIEVAA